MKSVLQRVSEARVTVDGETLGAIGLGVLVLFGVEKGDYEGKLDYQVSKLLKLRFFPDEAGKMNLSIRDIQGDLLVVSQFTLAGDCRKGTRPSFDGAMPPAEAKRLYDCYVARLRAESGLRVETGAFGALMAVSLVNDGPVTLLLEN